MEKIKTNTLILGGGLSGLLAAEILSHNNRSIVILEKEPYLGGLASTFNFKGFRFDIGGHKLCIKDPCNEAYFKNIIKNKDFLVLKRKSKTFLDNKYIDYPATFASVLKLKKIHVFNIAIDLLALKNNIVQDNFEKWIIANYGSYLYKIYFKDYTEKVWGLPCHELSSIWADKRIGGNNIFKLFKNILIRNADTKDSTRFFYYPRNGIGDIINSLEQKLKDKCKIYNNVQVCNLLSKNDKLESLFFIRDGQKYEIRFEELLSSIPIKELIVRMPNVPQDIFMASRSGIKYRNLILVCFIMKKKLISNWHWCYFPSKDIVFSRGYEPKFWSKDMAPREKTLLSSEIFCGYDDLYWKMNDNDLVSEVKKSMKFARLINDTNIISDSCVKKINYAYPLNYSGFENPLNRVKSFLNYFKNLYLIGRSGTHSYFDMEDCLDDVKKNLDKIKK